MSDQQKAQQVSHHAKEGIKYIIPGGGDSSSGQFGSKLLAVATFFPVGGILLVLSGLTLASTVIGLAVVTPLFVIFSPVLVPAAIAIGLALTGFVTSGAFGLTAITSLWGLMNHLRGPPQTMGYAKRRMGEGLQHVGLVPAAIAIGLALTGFATSGGFGLTAITSLWGLVNHLRRALQTMGYAMRRMGEGAEGEGK